MQNYAMIAAPTQRQVNGFNRVMVQKFYQSFLKQFGADRVAVPNANYMQEPRGHFQGQSKVVLRPHKTQEVADMVTYCFKHRVGIIPYGGGTGLVGGQICDDKNTVLLSLQRMNKIRAISTDENVMIIEAGAILSDVQAQAVAVNRLFPLSLASEGSCQVGGILATNAGGVRVLRYGMMRDLCLGIEAVFPNGTIFNVLQPLPKDNSGYDLRNLLIGSEGTLAIITAASLKLFPQPQQTATAFVKIAAPKAAVDLLSRLQQDLGDSLTAFEFISDKAYHFIAKTLPSIRLPFADWPLYSGLIEAIGNHDSNIEYRLQVCLQGAIQAGLLSEVLIAQSQAHCNDFWNFRKSIPLANRLIGPISSHDIALPRSMIADFIDKMPAQLMQFGAVRINCFGHIGDGNLHYNIFPTKGKTRAAYANNIYAIRQIIYDNVMARGGSFAAEHGIGRLKINQLQRYGDPAKLAAMQAIKNALDPKGIMNPGAVLKIL